MSAYPDPSASGNDRGYEPGGYLSPTAGLPPRPPAPGARVGQAYGVQVRQESQYAGSNATVALTVLELRLQEPGNPQPLDVLMRGRSLSGTVREGDWIEVSGKPDVAGRWVVARLQNLTTGTTVLMMGGRRGGAALVVVLAMIVLAVLVIGVAVAALASS